MLWKVAVQWIDEFSAGRLKETLLLDLGRSPLQVGVADSNVQIDGGLSHTFIAIKGVIARSTI